MEKPPAKLQIRMSQRLKDEAEAVFAEIGLDATTAVRLFFRKVAQTRSIPFSLTAEPEFSKEVEAHLEKAWQDSKTPANLSQPFGDVEAMFREIEGGEPAAS